jgi:hypothetical protein
MVIMMVGMTMISSSIFELAIDATIVGFNLINDFSQFEYAEYWVLSHTNKMSLCLSQIPSSNTN